MAELVLNPITKRLTDAYVRDPSHAICLVGATGAGLGTMAAHLAERLSGNAQTVTTIVPEKNLISIERVRQLYSQTRTKQNERSVFVIDDADAMSPEAQNSLLKLLEEPVTGVHFILTTHDMSKLLPTIRSRVQQLQILPISRDQSQKLLASYDHDTQLDPKILFIASGKPAEIIRLVVDNAHFEARSALVSDARSFLQGSAYERLKISSIYSSRDQAMAFLTECSNLLQFSVLKQKRFDMTDSMQVLDTVMKRVRGGGHVKTQLMYLVTKFN